MGIQCREYTQELNTLVGNALIEPIAGRPTTDRIQKLEKLNCALAPPGAVSLSDFSFLTRFITYCEVRGDFVTWIIKAQRDGRLTAI